LLLTVNVPAIPNIELDASVNVLLEEIVTLNKFAVPVNVVVPLKVVVPLVAVKLPEINKSPDIVAEFAVETEPVTVKLLNETFAFPLIDFDAPLIVIVLFSGVKVPLLSRLPAIATAVVPSDKFLVELICNEFKLKAPVPENVTAPSITSLPVPPSMVTPFATLKADLITSESPNDVFVPEPDIESD